MCYSLLFYFYAVFIAPVLLRMLQAVLGEGRESAMLGVVMLASVVLGFFSVWRKCRTLSLEMEQESHFSTRQVAFIFVVWMLHVTVCIMLAAAGLTAFGVDVSGGDGNAVWFGITATAIVLVEFFILFAIFAIRPRAGKASFIADHAGRLSALVFGCVVYTAYWDYMSVERLNDYTWLVFVMEALLFAVVFMVLFLPVKLPDMLDEFYLGGREGRKLRLVAMFAMGIFLAVYPPVLTTLKEGGRYTSLEKALAEPEKVLKLYLSGKKISSLPPEIAELSQLRVLRLTENMLSELPPEIGSMRGLEELRIANNRLLSLPSEIGLLTNLVRLDAWSNYISSIPPEIGNASNLEQIDLRWNSITNLPIELENLKNLERIRLTQSMVPVSELEKFRDSGFYDRIEY